MRNKHVPFSVCAAGSGYRCIPKFWTHRTEFHFSCDRSVREKAWCSRKRVAQATSAAPCLQVAPGELAAATRLRQARPLSACIRFLPLVKHLGTRRYLHPVSVCLFDYRRALACLSTVVTAADSAAVEVAARAAADALLSVSEPAQRPQAPVLLNLSASEAAVVALAEAAVGTPA
jgi:hypothetical protein